MAPPSAGRLLAPVLWLGVGALARFDPVCELFAHFPAQYFAGGVVLAAMALLLRRYPTLAIALGLALANLATIWPYAGAAPPWPASRPWSWRSQHHAVVAGLRPADRPWPAGKRAGTRPAADLARRAGSCRHPDRPCRGQPEAGNARPRAGARSRLRPPSAAGRASPSRRCGRGRNRTAAAVIAGDMSRRARAGLVAWGWGLG